MNGYAVRQIGAILLEKFAILEQFENKWATRNFISASQMGLKVSQTVLDTYVSFHLYPNFP